MIEKRTYVLVLFNSISELVGSRNVMYEQAATSQSAHPETHASAAISAKQQRMGSIVNHSTKSKQAAQLRVIADQFVAGKAPIQLATENLTLNGATSTVATSMSAVLDPASPPSYGEASSVDTDLDAIMNTLPTDPNWDGNRKFVKGHLLNDNLGGKANKNNLYPITGQANSDHKTKVENKIWDYMQTNTNSAITYTVDVTDRSVVDKNMKLKKNSGSYNDIQTPKATFTCKTTAGTNFAALNVPIKSEAAARYD